MKKANLLTKMLMLVLAFAMVLQMTACGGGSNDGKKDTAGAGSSKPAEPERVQQSLFEKREKIVFRADPYLQSDLSHALIGIFQQHLGLRKPFFRQQFRKRTAVFPLQNSGNLPRAKINVRCHVRKRNAMTVIGIDKGFNGGNVLGGAFHRLKQLVLGEQRAHQLPKQQLGQKHHGSF